MKKIYYIFKFLNSTKSINLKSIFFLGFVIALAETINTLIISSFAYVSNSTEMVFFETIPKNDLLKLCFILFVSLSLLNIYGFRRLFKKIHLSHVNYSKELFNKLILTIFPNSKDSSTVIELFRSDLLKLFDQILINIIHLFSKSIIIILTFVGIFIYSFSLGFTLLSIISFIFILNEFLIKEKIIKNGEINIVNLRKLTGDIIDFTNLWIESYVYKKTNFFLKRINNSTKSFSEGHFDNLFLATLPRGISEIVVISVLIIYSIIFIGDNNQIVFLFFFIALFRLMPLFLQISASLGLIRSSFKSYDNISSIMKEQKNINIQNTNKVLVEKLEIFKFEKHFNSLNSIKINEKLTFLKGNIYLVKGESGKGKTTFLNALAGIIDSDSLEFEINGKSYKEPDSLLSLTNLGYVPQRSHNFEASLTENIAFKDGQITNATIDLITDSVGLENLVDKDADKIFHNLSGGQTQRLSVSRALFFNAEIILFDEPTSSIDDDNKKNLIKILNRIKSNKIIIIVTHDNDLDIISDKTYLL